MLRYLLGFLLIASIVMSIYGCSSSVVEPKRDSKQGAIFPPRGQGEKQAKPGPIGI
jgi:hypothetical protein